MSFTSTGIETYAPPNASAIAEEPSTGKPSLGRRLASHEQFTTEEREPHREPLSRWHAILLIANLTGITFVGSMSTGLLTVGIPRIADDVGLSQSLLLW